MTHLHRIAICLLSLAGVTPAAPQSPPVIAGLGHAGLSAIDRGLVLMAELGCANCHDSRAHKSALRGKSAPDLTRVGERVLHPYLIEFLSNPRSVKPGTTMPDAMRGMTAPDRTTAAEQLTHFLLSSSAVQARPEAPDRLAFARGERLFHEVGCVACHAPRDKQAREKPGDGAQVAPLGPLETKYSVTSLMGFLAAPQHVRASGRMPNLNLSPVELYELSNYLVQNARVAGGLNFTLFVDGAAQAQGIVDDFGLTRWAEKRSEFALEFAGFLVVEKAGSYTFELKTGAVGRLTVGDRCEVSLEHGGTGNASIDLPAGRVPIALRFEHASGAPRLSVTWSGPDFKKRPLTRRALQATEHSLPRYDPLRIDQAKVAVGRALFMKLGCANCHARDVPAVVVGGPTADLDSQKGCLSGARGGWPFFELSESQRSDLRAALAAHDQDSSPEREIRRTLASYNCIACHQRSDYGGITASRDEFFTSHDLNLGEAGRLPPPLTGVGAKLQKEWLSRAIAYGQSIRSYVKTRMPGFGEAAGEHLAALFDAQDKLPPAPIEALPKDRKRRKEVRMIGHQLTGNKGMNCIACHSFGGRRSAAMAAVDLVASTGKRLKQDWFYHYMRNPLQFRADTVMPQFFPGGTSIRPDIAGGNVDKQLAGLWHYLAEGRNSRRPSGLIRQALEIVVGDEAIMLRRSVQNTGKRGISVGYPGGVNLTFDAESLAQNQIWWGKFVDASPVWSGQGSGSARIMERNRVDLGKGPAFAELASATAPWPTASRRVAGHEFKGYVLDKEQRPTFRYICHGVTITDCAVEVRQDHGRPTLRRTLSLEGDGDSTLFFRAVVHAEIEDRGDRGVRVGKHLVLHLPADSYHIRPAAKAKELIVEISIVRGEGSLVIEYALEETAK